MAKGGSGVAGYEYELAKGCKDEEEGGVVVCRPIMFDGKRDMGRGSGCSRLM